ncbi:MAG: DUF5668 domain-containing protein [Patescibacteria group bacterium]
MTNKPSRVIWGTLLIILGAVLLLPELGYQIDLGDFWPLFLLVPGLAFWLLFVLKRTPGMHGVLIPGTILTVYGLYFFYLNLTDFKYASESSFIYTLAVALAFFAAYFFGGRSKGLLVPAWLLTIISVIILISNTVQGASAWSIIIIVVGLWLLFGGRHYRSSSDNTPSPTTPDKDEASKDNPQ